MEKNIFNNLTQLYLGNKISNTDSNKIGSKGIKYLIRMEIPLIKVMTLGKC